MAARCALWHLCALCALLAVRSCSGAYTCPSICNCTEDSLRCDRDTELRARTRPGGGARTHLTLTRLTLKEVPTHAFLQLIHVTHIDISDSTCLTRIRRRAFLSLHSLEHISIQSIISLQLIDSDAFTDLPNLEYLTISNTGLRNFPDFSSISSLVPSLLLEMIDNPNVEYIPPNSFRGSSEDFIDMNLMKNGFREIHAHAFNGSNINELILSHNRYLRTIHQEAFVGARGPGSLDVSSTPLTSLPSRGLGDLRYLRALSTPALKSLPPPGSLAELRKAELTYPSHCCAFNNWLLAESVSKNSTAICDMIDPDVLYNNDYSDYPGLVARCLDKTPTFKCTPEPDAFNPCEDLLGSPLLRFLTWIITLFAVLGNVTVLVVMLIRCRKMSISRFLMCNLAFADLCMGLYLMLIAVMDHYSLQEYYNHATDWQTGPGCATAGFLTVFASQLSVYTLTMISVERWHTISNAMHINKHLRMPHVAAIMAVGWAFSVLVAVLPLVGVSSYSKVSICLPMDIDETGSQVYVVAVLVFNVVAFVVVCLCYICIYLSVHRAEQPALPGDTRIAKRMAVLIFTDFVCMAPISFFAISAALNMPLITVSHSKILLVIFYPINSLCNPFLYTIFTRAFRKDVFQLLWRCTGRHRGQADLSRGRGTARETHPLDRHAHRVKMNGCFLSNRTT